MLLAHTWRGNVRELENTHASRRAAVARRVGAEPSSARRPAIDVSRRQLATRPRDAVAARRHRRAGRRVGLGTALVGRTVADVERDLILDTLDHCLGNRTHAANILGISIRTLRNKLKQYSERRRRRARRRGEGDAALDRLTPWLRPRHAPAQPRPAQLSAVRQLLEPIGMLRSRGDMALAIGVMAILVGADPADADIAARHPRSALSITFSVLILMTALFIQKPLEFQLLPDHAADRHDAAPVAQPRLDAPDPGHGHEGPTPPAT